MEERNYADGLRDGEIKALQEIMAKHQQRLDDHSNRLRIIERIIWAMAGIIAFIQFLPYLQKFSGG